jgi:exportin-1
VLVQLVLSFPDKQEQKWLLTKLNGTLISIVKHEWRTSWTNFIPDICGSAKESENKCENALNILKLLSEEVFDFSKN